MTASTCLVVMYHYVRDARPRRFPRFARCRPALFEQQLDWLQARLHARRSGRDRAAVAAAAALPDGRAASPSTTASSTITRRSSRSCGARAVAARSSSRRTPAARRPGARRPQDAFPAGAARRRGLRPRRARPKRASAPRRAARGVFGVDRWEAPTIARSSTCSTTSCRTRSRARARRALPRRIWATPAAFARELYLDEPMIREMAAGGMTFGYHTRTHRMLSRLRVEEQRQELPAAWAGSAR